VTKHKEVWQCHFMFTELGMELKHL